MLLDNSEQIQTLIEQEKIHAVTTVQAGQFYSNNQEMWTVVLAPWFFVQLVNKFRIT